MYQRLLVCCLRNFSLSLYDDETNWKKWRKCHHSRLNDDAFRIVFHFVWQFLWFWFICEFEQKSQRSQFSTRIRFDSESSWQRDASEVCSNRERYTKEFFKLIQILFIKLKTIISKHVILIFLQYQQRTCNLFSQVLRSFLSIRLTHRKQIIFQRNFTTWIERTNNDYFSMISALTNRRRVAKFIIILKFKILKKK